MSESVSFKSYLHHDVLINKILLLNADIIKTLTSEERNVVVKIFEQMNKPESEIFIDKGHLSKLKGRLVDYNKMDPKKKGFFSGISRIVQNLLGLRVSSENLESQIETMQAKVKAQQTTLLMADVRLTQAKVGVDDAKENLSEANKALGQAQGKMQINKENFESSSKMKSLERDVKSWKETIEVRLVGRLNAEEEFKKAMEDAKKLGINIENLKLANGPKNEAGRTQASFEPISGVDRDSSDGSVRFNVSEEEQLGLASEFFTEENPVHKEFVTLFDECFKKIKDSISKLDSTAADKFSNEKDKILKQLEEQVEKNGIMKEGDINYILNNKLREILTNK